MHRVAEHFSYACQKFYQVSNACETRRTRCSGWPSTSPARAKGSTRSIMRIREGESSVQGGPTLLLRPPKTMPPQEKADRVAKQLQVAS